MPPLRVGVVGVGSLGQHHARVYAALDSASLAGVFDVDAQRSAEIAGRHGCRAFESLEALLRETDAVSVAVPTVDHRRVAGQALERGRHVLVEKPLTTTLQEADELIALARGRGVVLQAGHIERFNPALDLLRRHVLQPRFVEVHRLGSFSPRSLDIDVVLDLMIHDLDIVLSLDGSEAVQVDAVGVPVLTPRVDIANARVRFASGLIANLTASRVSYERIRKFRVFAPRTYVSLDFAARAGQVYRLGERDGQPDIEVEKVSAPEDEPLKRQLEAFVQAARGEAPVAISGEDGRRALALAHRILKDIDTGATSYRGQGPGVGQDIVVDSTSSRDRAE
jgi:predicted dehydrogenase